MHGEEPREDAGNRYNETGKGGELSNKHLKGQNTPTKAEDYVDARKEA